MHRTDIRYPHCLERTLGHRVPAVVFTLGDPELLGVPMIALFCSVRCTGRILLQTQDFLCGLGSAGPVIVSGFHSPLERHCLEILLARRVPGIICPARGLGTIRLPVAWREPLRQGRLLILSPFAPSIRRAAAGYGATRNRFVAALADEVLIPCASAGGRTEALARLVRSWGKPLWTFADEANGALMHLGARIPDPLQRRSPAGGRDFFLEG